MTAEISGALRARREELRQRLCEMAGLDSEPEPGSDAALLIDALCGASADSYLPKFDASARVLAEQGGHLEARLAGMRRWCSALAEAIDEVLADDDGARAQAQRLLAEVVAQVAVTLARGVQAVADEQPASAVERARRGAARMQALQRINSAANSTLDLDQTLSITAHAVAQEMGADLCAIFLFDEVTRELELRATSGPHPTIGRRYTLGLGEGHTGWVAEHGHPLLVADALDDPRFAPEAGAYQPPLRGVLSVPIIYFTVEKLEGVISVQSAAPRAFSEEDVNFLEIVAGQLATSIENGRLYEQTDEELRRRVHELSTLHRVSAMVASTLVFDHVLTMIVAQAVQLSGADRSVLFELDPATQQLVAVASHGFGHLDGPGSAPLALRAGQCCAGIVVRTGEPRMQIDCMRSDETCFLHSRQDELGDQHSVLCVPLATRHGPLGALCVFSSQRHLLNTHQLQLVRTFANVAAIAMENARLFEQTREGLRTKETLLRMMHHLVKNNLQQVASILNMQRRRTKLPEVEQILVESVDRIQSLAATHDLLSSTELGVARVDDIARKIAGIVRGNMVPPNLRVRFEIEAIPQHVPSERATTLAIVLNELLSNAIEHGFAGRARGVIRISGARAGEQLALQIADDGWGPPADFSVESADGLGLQLVRGLVQSDLRGDFAVFRSPVPPAMRGAAECLSDPRLPAVSQDDEAGGGEAPESSESSEGAGWTIAQVSFPLVLAAEGAAPSTP